MNRIFSSAYQLLVKFLELSLRLHGKPKSCVNWDEYQMLPNRLDLFTVAFNNVKMIEHQIRLVRKYVLGNYNYVVADNSSNMRSAEAIKELCRVENVVYFRLPKNLLRIVGASHSHAASLNWIFYNMVKKMKPDCFGFIDHDLFPVRNVSIEGKLAGQTVYGKVVERGDYWYLWAGLCFFRFDFVKDLKVDFMPVKENGVYLDTGGGNWTDVYSRIDKAGLADCVTELEEIREGGDYHSDFMQHLDDCWIHMINGSNWANKKPRNISYLLQKSKTDWVNKKPKDGRLVDSILNKY